MSLEKQDLSTWEKELEKEARTFVDKEIWELKAKNPMLPENVLRQRLKEQYLKEARMDELNDHIKNAFRIIQEEGGNYLSENEWNDLKNEIEKGFEIIRNLDEEILHEMSFLDMLGLTDKALGAIETIGRKKYQEKDFENGLSIYAFLTTLLQDHADLWYRLGILLQEKGDLERSIVAYDTAFELDGTEDKNVGPIVFSAECLKLLGRKAEANERLEKARELIHSNQSQSKWLESLNALSVC
jgi:tetratricopeptide (TPR) repeat protein